MEDYKRIESLVVATLKSDGDEKIGTRAILELVSRNGAYVLRRFDTEEEVLNQGVNSHLVAVEIEEIPDSLLTEDEIIKDKIHCQRLVSIQEKLNQEYQNSLGKKPYTKQK